jgi:hypothetical protein
MLPANVCFIISVWIVAPGNIVPREFCKPALARCVLSSRWALLTAGKVWLTSLNEGSIGVSCPLERPDLPDSSDCFFFRNKGIGSPRITNDRKGSWWWKASCVRESELIVISRPDQARSAQIVEVPGLKN